MPYSGPASAFGTMGRTEAAYFQMVNEAGGIRGRKITLLSLDDGYSPPKTVEQTRRLVEQENVLMIYGSVGTAHATATHKYLNSKHVPQLFIATSGLALRRSEEFSMDHGAAAQSARRHVAVRALSLEDAPEREGRAPLSERRLRQGLRQSVSRCARRASRSHRGGAGFVRSDRSDSRFADRRTAGVGRRCAVHFRFAEIRGDDHPQGLRHRLEATAVSCVSGCIGEVGVAAGGPGEISRRDLGAFSEGCSRCRSGARIRECWNTSRSCASTIRKATRPSTSTSWVTCGRRR